MLVIRSNVMGHNMLKMFTVKRERAGLGNLLNSQLTISANGHFKI